PLLSLSVAVALPVLVQGGFTAGSRSLLMALAAISLSLALLRDERRVIALLRAPAVLCLLGLAALAIVSSSWTIGSPIEAIRWGLVIASLAAIAIVAGQAGGRDRVASLAVLIVALA